MRGLPDASFDAIVTDPPYALTANKKGGSGVASVSDTPAGRSRIGSGNGAGGFMGQQWDAEIPGLEVWAEAHRVAKPGAHLLAFGGTRTYHRLACAIEDAGWQLQDCLCWLYGSGFPKHRSRLKPAWEPILLAWNPGPRATPLNIELCRVGKEDTRQLKSANLADFPHNDDAWMPRPTVVGSDSGRWPANVVLDEAAAQQLDQQTGELTSGANPTRRSSPITRNTYGEFKGQECNPPVRGIDVGGASRFFYCAKASRAEREIGLHGEKTLTGRSLAAAAAARGESYDNGDSGFNRTTLIRNHHPTVKPVALMRWLLRLIVPAAGRVLDPFAGSGTTGVAAHLEGFSSLLIEREAAYLPIIEQRVEHAIAQPSLFDVGVG